MSASHNNAAPDSADRYAIIGAGPAGLAAARALQRNGIPFQGFELGSNVGGLWDIDAPQSTMYESAHLISSKGMTEFKEFPMPDHVATFPHHSDLRQYFRDFAAHFKIYDDYQFDTEVTLCEPLGVDSSSGWRVQWKGPNGTGEGIYKGVLIANGQLAEPNLPTFEGEFAGELMHSGEYKSPEIFRDKKVLVVGCGNSACDIAIDAVHYGKGVGFSARRGYYFVPKYIFGKPMDTIGGKFKLPLKIKQKVDAFILKFIAGTGPDYGLPEPDHKLYEAHPVINTLILYHIGHGDINVEKDVQGFAGKTVIFKDGSREDYDMVLLATGYKLHFPFIDRELLNWQDASPHFYLNAFHPDRDDLFLLGMVEATGLGWEGRAEQAELVARYIKAVEAGKPAAREFHNLKKEPFPDMRGGVNYLKLDRMAYYVHKDTYRNTIGKHLKEFA